ncbi:MAG: hypothetical protein CVU39_24760 [Chloroflexi bacterium HGW-Chloroflexi-10]|nr:MAG: hypothetical protein CVU39_24760 [Chloroflexi bacterium HGW-Chloroflexi-10]
MKPHETCSFESLKGYSISEEALFGKLPDCGKYCERCFSRSLLQHDKKGVVLRNDGGMFH